MLHFDIIKVLFIHQLMHQRVVLKSNIKIYIKTAPYTIVWSLSLRLHHQNPVYTSSILRKFYMTRPSHSIHTRVSTSGLPEQKERIKFRKIWRLAVSGCTKTASFSDPQKKIRTVLNPGTGVATALTRHLLSLCVLSTFVASFD